MHPCRTVEAAHEPAEAAADLGAGGAGPRAGRGRWRAGRATGQRRRRQPGLAAVTPRLVRLLLALVLSLAARGASAQSERAETLEHQSLTRHYLLRLPGGATGSRPLVIGLHGLSDAPDWRDRIGGLRAWWRMDAVADREGFVLAYPAAVSGRWSYSDQRPLPIPGRAELVDDLGFLSALIDRLVARGIADPARVFVAGASRGGLMAWSMACALSEQIAAAAPLITGMTDGQLPGCRPTRRVPLLALAGTRDRTQIYDGWIYPTYRLLSVPETMEFWRRLYGCTGQVGRALPHREPSDLTRVSQVEWTGCAAGGALRLYRVEGGGHQLPSLTPMADPPDWAGAQNRDIETAEEVWRFFSDLAPPDPPGR